MLLALSAVVLGLPAHAADPDGDGDAGLGDTGLDAGEATEELLPSAEPGSLAVEVDDPLRPFQWNLDRINAPEAWSLTLGSPDVTIAVIDTGVDPDHRDLDGAFWADPVTGLAGYDHLADEPRTYLDAVADWHGTAVAGVAVARTDDAYGLAGVAPRVSLMVHRIYASTSQTTPPNEATYAGATRAIEAATAAGADVILLTWGGPAPDAALFDAISASGVPVVASAGNDGQDLSDAPEIRRFPAMFRLPNLVTVAATDSEDRILDNERLASNYGVRHVDVAAPGEDILSVRAGGNHALYEGTSFAAPHVAAALALGRSLAPATSANELVGTLLRTVQPTATLTDAVTAGGVIDVAAFLRALERPVCTPQIPAVPFDDVPRDAVHVTGIDCIAWHGITRGTGDGSYAPARAITRGEMATFISRLLDAAGELPPATTPRTFSDIDTSVHATSIDRLGALGIVSGTRDGRFEPAEPVTRAQMTTFLGNAITTLVDLPSLPERAWFDDVDGSVHRSSILLARELGITLGTTEPREFGPDRLLTRAQMASFIARSMDALGRQGATIERLP